MQSNYEKYINSPISYVNDKLISEHVNYAIMGQHETLIMEKSAEIVCQNGGKVLNVGFGMGIIDSFIRDHQIEEHHIVEVHPDVVNKAIDMGFDKTATIYESDWRNLIEEWNQQGTQFDGIYFDTIVLDENRKEWDDFAKIVDSILAPGGIFSFFNNMATSPFFNVASIWKTLEEFGYQKHSKLIKYEDIKAQAIHKDDMKLLIKGDYNLVWYIKK